jgi:hypothetical protein
MDFEDILEELNTQLGDTDDFTFTPEEKTRALTEAFNDSSVVKVIWSSATTFDASTYQYAIPGTMDTVKDIYISTSNSTSDEPEKISANLWEVVGANIQFRNGANSTIPQGYTLYIKGNYKYTISDTVAETKLQEYILSLAQLRCLKSLGNKKLNRFLKNDTSIAEIVTWKRELQQEVSEYRRSLPRDYEVM